MRYLTEAEYLDGYRLLVRFDDGKLKVVDLGPHLTGAVCEPLRDVEYFRSFRFDPDLDNIVWENGADFAPEFLYEIGEETRTERPAGGPPLRSRH